MVPVEACTKQRLQKHMDVMALAAFAGYTWDWAIKRFETMAGRFQD
jgi:hypothetical protein